MAASRVGTCPGITLLPTPYDDTDSTTVVAQDIGSDISAHSDLAGVFAVNVITAQGAATAVGSAVAAHRRSAQAGNPLSERKLAQMFGRTSRRWARARIAEARRVPPSGLMVDPAVIVGAQSRSAR